MAKPSIKDLASAAKVSPSTVNRMISDPHAVRIGTRQQVLRAAAEIGFYGLGALTQNAQIETRPFRLTLLLQQPNRWFCEQVADGFQRARNGLNNPDTFRLRVEHLDDLSPEAVADRMQSLARSSDAIAVIAAEHPIITDTIELLAKRKVPVYAIISPLTASSLAGFVGLDSRKVGRTAAWAINRFCTEPGKVSLLLGSHRYRSHELAESGFRSYFREHDLKFHLLEPISTFESDGIGREVTERLLKENPDIAGIFLSGGGTNGVLAALRDAKLSRKVVAIAYDLSDVTRTALLDGTLDMVISHPFFAIGQKTIETILFSKTNYSTQSHTVNHVNFEIFISENV
jgi:LacI family transcriptional regulator